MKYPYVIDCASVDGDTLDGAALKADGCEGIIIRAELGMWLDPDFVKHRKVAVDAGLMWGGYLYPNWSRPIEDQAKLFFKVLGSLGPGCFPPCIDIEEGDLRRGSAFNGQSPAVVVEKWKTFLRLAMAQYKSKALSYTSARVILEGLHGADVSSLDSLTNWWLTPYTNYFKSPPLPPGVKTWALHQFKGDQPDVPGVKGRVDLSRFNPELGYMRAFFDTQWNSFQTATTDVTTVTTAVAAVHLAGSTAKP